jgi:hypothetical protein
MNEYTMATSKRGDRTAFLIPLGRNHTTQQHPSNTYDIHRQAFGCYRLDILHQYGGRCISPQQALATYILLAAV